MKKLVAVAVTAFLALTVGAADGPKQDPVAADVLKLADEVRGKDWPAAKKAAAAVAKDHERPELMDLFKPRKENSPGLGIGPKPGAITPDGIDSMIGFLARNPPPGPVLARRQKDLIRMAEVAAAIVATAYHQCPVEQLEGAKDPKDWRAWSEDTFKKARGLIAALEAKQPQKVKQAAVELRNACARCHATFR
jgi:hypothetical protein